MASLRGSTAPTPEEDEEASLVAVNLAFGSALQMTVRAAIELGILDILVQSGPSAKLSSADVVARLSANNNPQAVAMVDRMLRLLAANGVVRCTVVADGSGRQSRVYGPTPVCKYLSQNEVEGSMGPLCALNHDKVFMESWYYLKDAVLDGGVAFDRAHGMTAFEYPGIDPCFNKLFNDAMKNHSMILINKLLETYRGFDDLKVLVDVGGGVGTTLQTITSKHPNIKAINFDLPHVVSEAPPLAGVEHVGGDMFETVPSGDAIFMKWILHDWTDEHCAKLLRNCWKALLENGKVILFECILPESPEPTLRNQFVIRLDLVMLAYNPGGKERTTKEFEALAKKAGFSGFKSTYIFCSMWVIELTK